MEQKQRVIDVKKIAEDNMDMLPKMLTTTEKEILAILLKSSHPQNTLQIRNVFSAWKSSAIRDMVFEDPAFINDRNVKAIRERSNNKKFAPLPSNPTPKEIRKLLKFIGNQITELNKDFNKYFPTIFLIPSYDKIENDLLSLEIMGLISKREDKLKNAKYLWFIDPAFYSSWLNKKRGVLKEIKENDIKFVEELYTSDILDFYLITEKRENKIENKILRYYLDRGEKTGKEKASSDAVLELFNAYYPKKVR